MNQYDLVVMDSHVSPDEDLRRFRWLGKLINEERPRRIIAVGDMMSLDSCSDHDERGTKKDRKRPTFKQDRAAWLEAQRLMFGPVDRWNKSQRSHGHKQYQPEMHYIKGNHEERFDRRANRDPDVIGSIVSFDKEMGIADRWDEVHDFGTYVTIGGIDYTHVPHNKMGRVLTGVGVGRAICQQASNHVVFGHTHTMNFTTLPLLGSKNAVRCSLNGPAFMEQGHIPDYAKNTQTGWVYGLTRIRPNTDPKAAFSFDYVSMEQLKEKYG